MLLQYIKKISPEAMIKLQAAKAKVDKLFALDSDAFLCRDLESLAEKKLGGVEAFPTKPQIKKAVTAFPEPGQGFTIKENAIFFNEGPQKGPAGNLFFECGGKNYPQGISVLLRQGGQRPPFSLGPFYPGAAALAFFKAPNLLALASYFYNRLPLYKQIREILLFSQAEYASVLGSAFTEDLIALFSAEVPVEEPDKIKVPHTNLKKARLSAYTGKDQEVKKLMTLLYTGLENHKEKGITGRYDTGDIKLHIFLRGGTKLIIDATLLFPLEDFDQTLEKAASDKAFNFAVNFRVEAWLRQYIFMADFGIKILEKVKGKILLENI